ncbi:hypothetical protein PHLGIDRAFT_405262 [Phlebiopsis gigantea 11061_1 CR5-6]|uniref:Uncharacterized protein n=1 Tax=Phlebiopsis gigantea (strain 11061_1 CR5-6) TaxID=745531 RepID=A0A0C3NRS5_PHLG1|nr:hypothetical protein PHLGIDRAFT_405262 [Phlebiopsis gigantea 11061_1 CR5-6]
MLKLCLWSCKLRTQLSERENDTGCQSTGVTNGSGIIHSVKTSAYFCGADREEPSNMNGVFRPAVRATLRPTRHLYCESFVSLQDDHRGCSLGRWRANRIFLFDGDSKSGFLESVHGLLVDSDGDFTPGAGRHDVVATIVLFRRLQVELHYLYDPILNTANVVLVSCGPCTWVENACAGQFPQIRNTRHPDMRI